MEMALVVQDDVGCNHNDMNFVTMVGFEFQYCVSVYEEGQCEIEGVWLLLDGRNSPQKNNREELVHEDVNLDKDKGMIEVYYS